MASELRTIIVDDDYKACQNMKLLIEKHCPDLKYVGEAYTVKDAAALVTKEKPELVFLDMRMGSERGFELFKLADLSNCKVIIASAYEEFAIDAFEFSAIDYLLKPINAKRLQGAVKKAKQEIEDHNNEKSGYHSLIHEIQEIKKSTSTPHRVSIPTIFGSVFLDYTAIIRCEADRNYTRIFMTDNKTVMSSKNLSEIQSLLPESVFQRIHHSHIINLNFMVEYHKGKQGYVVMSDESEIPISQNKKSSFLDRLS
jgi:two-component system LytT family response regulator